MSHTHCWVLVPGGEDSPLRRDLTCADCGVLGVWLHTCESAGIPHTCDGTVPPAHTRCGKEAVAKGAESCRMSRLGGGAWIMQHWCAEHAPKQTEPVPYVSPLRATLLVAIRENPGVRFGVLTERSPVVRERELIAMELDGLIEYRDNQPCALLAGPQVFLAGALMAPGSRRLAFKPGVGMVEWRVP